MRSLKSQLKEIDEELNILKRIIVGQLPGLIGAMLFILLGMVIMLAAIWITGSWTS